MAKAKRLAELIQDRAAEMTDAEMMFGRLNDQQEQFCMEYVVDLNGTQAAIRAGYHAKTAAAQASYLLTDPKILTRVGDLIKEREVRTRTTQDKVLVAIWELYDRCMQAKPVMEWDRDAKRMVATGEWMFNAAGAAKAVELLGKHLAMYTEKVDVNVKEGLGERVRLARERAAKRIEEMHALPAPNRRITKPVAHQ